MVSAEITLQRRRWGLIRRRRFVLHVPSSWEDVHWWYRQRWWRKLMTLPRPDAIRAMVRDLTPRWVRKHLSELDMAGITLLFDWMQAEADCSDVPVPDFIHRGVTYHMPAVKGENMSCMEFGLACDYYDQFTRGDSGALLKLVACLWREADPDAAAGRKREDVRVPLFSKAEVTHRAQLLRDAPHELLLQALLYFSGLKAFMHKIYGTWLFEPPDEEDDEPGSRDTSGPNFGWWGTFQQVAESGVFGDINQVHQAHIHDVCVFLVRKQVEMRSVHPSSIASKQEDENEE